MATKYKTLKLTGENLSKNMRKKIKVTYDRNHIEGVVLSIEVMIPNSKVPSNSKKGFGKLFKDAKRTKLKLIEHCKGNFFEMFIFGFSYAIRDFIKIWKN